MTEKQPFSEAADCSDPRHVASDPDIHISTTTQDDALKYLRGSEREILEEVPPDEELDRKLRRKNDFRMMPLLAACYFVTFLDKTNLNYAQIMGLSKDLKLHGNEYSDISSIFYIGALIGELLFVHPLQRFGAGKILGCCIIAWGICTACHAALENFAGIVVLRLVSGILEAPIPPTLMLLSSQWYTRKEQAPRFGIWYTGMGVAQVAGGLISYGFQWVPETAPIKAWRAMFIALGGFTILTGIAVLLVVPDTPMQARFLTEDEKKRVLYHVRGNQTGIKGKKFAKHQLLEGLLDPQMWFLFIIILLEGTGSGTIIAYSSTLIRGFGYDSKQAALLNMPSGVMNIISSNLCCFAVYLGCKRGLVIMTATALGVIGACLMSWLPHSNKGGLLVGIYLANAIIGATPVAYQWILTNTAGHTKRALVTAAMTAAFSIGSLIGPLTFQAKDAPEYQPAKVSLVVTWAVSGLVALILLCYYRFENKRRGVKVGSEDVPIQQAFAGLTDKENTEFRYIY